MGEYPLFVFAFGMGAGALVTISIQFAFKVIIKSDNSYKSTQKGNIVNGDQAGRDVLK